MKRLIKELIVRALHGALFHLLPAQHVECPSANDALQHLMKHYPDASTSSLCCHEWSVPEYDLTIIVPVYNVRKYLNQCMDSILNQKTNYSYHVIVVNDGSTDGSEKILEEYCDNDKISIIHQSNGGISRARNTALAKVNGRYIMFVDSDDFLMENAVQSLVSVAYETDADIVQGGYFFADEAGMQYGHGQCYQTSVDVAPNGTLAGMPWGKVYRAQLFQGIQFPEDYWYEDTIITAIITHLAGRIATTSDMVCYYRQNPAGITKSSRGKPKSIDTYWIHRSVMQDRQKLGLVTDCAFYEHLLRMIVLSYQRTEAEPDAVKISMFVLWKEMLEQEKKGEFAINSRYKYLEKAILEGDYKKYSILCKYYW